MTTGYHILEETLNTNVITMFQVKDDGILDYDGKGIE